MILRVMHLQGKVVGSVRPPFNNAHLPLIAGDEFAKTKTLDATLAAVKQATMGASKPGALIVGDARYGYEAYWLNVVKTPQTAAVPYHFEGIERQGGVPWPRFSVAEGVMFVDGDTVLKP